MCLSCVRVCCVCAACVSMVRVRMVHVRGPWFAVFVGTVACKPDGTIAWMGNNCAEDMPCPAAPRTPFFQFNAAARHAAIAKKKQQEADELAAYQRLRDVRERGCESVGGIGDRRCGCVVCSV